MVGDGKGMMLCAAGNGEGGGALEITVGTNASHETCDGEDSDSEMGESYIIDSCPFYEHLVRCIDGAETLTLAFQPSENSIIPRNSSMRRVSRRAEVQRSSPKRWCFKVFTAIMPHE